MKSAAQIIDILRKDANPPSQQGDTKDAIHERTNNQRSQQSQPAHHPSPALLSGSIAANLSHRLSASRGSSLTWQKCILPGRFTARKTI